MTSQNAMDYWFDGLPLVEGQNGALIYWFGGLPITFIRADDVAAAAPASGGAAWAPYANQVRVNPRSSPSNTSTTSSEATESRSERTAEPTKAEARAEVSEADRARLLALARARAEGPAEPAQREAPYVSPLYIGNLPELMPNFGQTLNQRRAEIARIALDDAEVFALIAHIEAEEAAAYAML